jgi:catechol 2,3-dioxygenase-like lactoylglutathione lyase family enzyme
MKPIQITELDHIVLNVADIDRSLEFYRGVLGLSVERLQEFRSGKVGFPSVRINGETIIDLFPVKRGGVPVPQQNPAPNLNHFCMVIGAEDFSGIVSYLKEHGVTVHEGPISRWGARGQATSVYFQDPDGNEIELRCY